MSKIQDFFTVSSMLQKVSPNELKDCEDLNPGLPSSRLTLQSRHHSDLLGLVVVWSFVTNFVSRA